MSTSDLRERLRKLAERTAKELENSKKKRGQKNQSTQSDGDKENSVTAASTDTRMTCTAPTKLLKNVNSIKSSISKTVAAEALQQPNTSCSIATSSASTVVSCSSIPRSAEIATSFAAAPSKIAVVITPQHSSKAAEECPKVEDLVVRNDLSGLKSVAKYENRKKRTTSAHIEQATSTKSTATAVTTQTLHRSESASSSRSSRYIHVNGRAYVVIDLLGKGGSSKVYQVLDEDYKKLRAVKCVDLSEADEKCRNAYLNEIKLLLSLRDSGCVVEMLDYELRGDILYVVMEKGDTDLATFLKTRRNQIDDIFIRFYWSEMLKCVQTIHNKGIVHSDLKPANFLLVGGNLKLIDFGIASAIPTNKTSVMKESQMGTLSYMPPEAIGGSSAPAHNGKEIYKVHKKSDVWALGCILYNMVYGRTPYQMWVNPVQKMHAILNKPVIFEKIDDADLMDVLKRCLTRDPDQRASVEELQNHPYLTRKSHNCFNESTMLQDESDFIKVAEDLRSCTPRTSARKLRDLMEKRNMRSKSSSANKFI